MIIEAKIKKNNGKYGCNLKIIKSSKQFTHPYDDIYYNVYKVFDSYDLAMAYYVTMHRRESAFIQDDIPSMNMSCNVRISEKQYRKYIKISQEELPHLWI